MNSGDGSFAQAPWVSSWVALTGPAGAGKSALADRLQALGAGLIDADVLARQVVCAGSEGLAALIVAIGAWALRPDGTLDRAALRARLVADVALKERVEAVLHPRIRAAAVAALGQATGAPYTVLAVPLWIEQGGWTGPWGLPLAQAAGRTLAGLILVEADAVLRLERVAGRDGVTPEAAAALFALQAQDSQRDVACAAAPEFAARCWRVRNEGDTAALDAAAAALHSELLAARSRDPGLRI